MKNSLLHYTKINAFFWKLKFKSAYVTFDRRLSEINKLSCLPPAKRTREKGWLQQDTLIKNHGNWYVYIYVETFWG